MNARSWLAFGLFAVAACRRGPAESNVEIYSWWESDSEKAALDSVINNFHKTSPNIGVTNAAALNSLSAQDELQSRMHLGDPPDTFQVNGGVQLAQYVDAGQLEVLDSLFDDLKLGSLTVPIQILDAVTVVSNQGSRHYYAVPVDLARVNVLFYNKAVLGDLQPPTTVDQFVQVSQALMGKVPVVLAVGDQTPWTLEVIFKGCLAAQGTTYYNDFVNGQNAAFAEQSGTPTVDPTFNRAIDCFSRIMAYADPGMRGYTWNIAVKKVESGAAAMTIMGDWALGEFILDKGVPGVTFGAVPAPDSQGTFIFTTDTFVLPYGAHNRDGAIAFLKEWGSPSGQAAFSPVKGSLPSRTDVSVDLDGGNPIALALLTEFKEDDVVPDWAIAVPPAFSNNFDLALDRFAADGNAENLVLAARNNYDLIMNANP